MARQTGEFTKATREQVLTAFNGTCAGCGMHDADYIEVDHVQPRIFYTVRKIPVDISFKNGQVLCHACNKIKGDIEYLPRLAPRIAAITIVDCIENRQVFRAMVEAHRSENSKTVFG